MARRAGDTSPKRWAARVSAAVILAMACAWLPYQLVGGGKGTVDRLQRELDRTRAEAAGLERHNAALARDIAALRTDPRAIEDVARRDLGLVEPGQLILRIERPPSEGGE